MLKSIVKRAFRWIGLDIRRYVPPLPYHARLTKLLSANHVNLVFDVGANVGQFAQSLRAVGYTGRIVSFEPLNDAWKELQEASRQISYGRLHRGPPSEVRMERLKFT